MKQPSIVLAGVIASMLILAVAQSASASEVRIAPKDCQRLVQHRPAADVAYKPGVDVHGRSVASADLPGQARITGPNEIAINLTVDVLQQYGVPADSLLSPSGEASVGTVKYDIAAGRLTYNGQPLSDPEQDALAAACATSPLGK